MLFRDSPFSGACETEVMIVILLKILDEISVFILLNLAVDMVPLGAFLTLDPLLAIGDVRVAVVVDLFAKVTVLVLVESLGAYFAKPDKCLLVYLPTGPPGLILGTPNY